MASMAAVYLCALCDGTFTTKDIYRQHMHNVHQRLLAGETARERSSLKPKITILDVDKPSVPIVCISDAESTGVEQTDDAVAEIDAATLKNVTKKHTDSVGKLIPPEKSSKNRSLRSKDKSTTDVTNPRSKRNPWANSEECLLGMDNTLAVECGPNEARLCLKRLAQARKVDSRQSGKCIFFSDEWLTPSDFIETSIRASLVEWQEFIYHNNRTFKWLLDNQVVSLSPPACHCDSCKQIKTQGVSLTSRQDSDKTTTVKTNASSVRIREDTLVSKPMQKASSSIDTTKADGRPPGSELALPVQCGSNEAWLCIGRLREPTEKSIYFEGRWLTPTVFAEESELGWLHNWKLATKHHGATLFSLFNDKIVTISPPMCRCKFCKPNQQSDDSSPSSSIESDGDVNLEVSDDEDDEAAAIMSEAGTMLPEEYEVRGAIWVLRVECGPNTAWMCIGLLSQVRHEREKKCVLFEGRWLTPAEFMHVSGRGALRSWKGAIRHHNKTLDAWFKHEIITISPPACQCDLCKDGSSRAQRYVCTFCSDTFSTEGTCMAHISKVHPSEKLTTNRSAPKGTKTKQASSTGTNKDDLKKVPSGGENVTAVDVASTSRETRHCDDVSTSVAKSNVSKELISEYGEYPPGKDSLLPVECGPHKGWLDLSCLVQSSTTTLGKSVYHDGEWIHVQEFRKRAGKDPKGNWMSVVKHFDVTIHSLLKHNTIIISTCSCSCDNCTHNTEPNTEEEPESKSTSVKALPLTPSSKAELVKIYGEYPPEEDFALPVECALKKGWLCLKYVDQNDTTRECIYSGGKWYTRDQFKNLGGYEHRPDWKLCICHYGKMINGLMKNQTLVVSPPSCSCKNCIAAGRGHLQINTSKTHVDDKLVWLYGEAPPDVEYVLPIECGPQKGWLCLEYIDESPVSPTECIYSYGEWYTRGQFKNVGGYDQRGSWRKSFKHFGVTLYCLFRDSVLTLSPPSCKCNNCSGNTTEECSPPQLQEKEERRSSLPMHDLEAPVRKSHRAIQDPKAESSSKAAPRTSAEAKKPIHEFLAGYSDDELVKEYGERPPNEDFALPIECGPNRAWMCIQYFNRWEPGKSVECVYSSGKWYTRNQFKKSCGYQDGDNWKSVFNHFGQKYWDLEKTNILSISPPSCRCDKCSVHVPVVKSSSVGAAGKRTTDSSEVKKPMKGVLAKYVSEELVKEYGEHPPNEDFALPIECGLNRGWLCIQYFNVSEPAKTPECIYSFGKWYKRNQFKMLSGYELDNWKCIFKHFGQRYRYLEQNNILTFSPPTCRCDNCSVHDPVVESSSASLTVAASKSTIDSSTKKPGEEFSAGDNDDELVKEYGERPPNEQFALPVECGSNRGWLCMPDSVKGQSSRGYIFSHGEWYGRNQFKKLSGYQMGTNWKHIVRHFGQRYADLEQKNLLTFSPPSCQCSNCSGHEASTMRVTTDQLVKAYGECPRDVKHTLPIECGYEKGWLCLEYINESDPLKAQDCIYSQGKWYTCQQFKRNCGYQDNDGWENVIRHFGETFKSLLDYNILTLSPPCCSCLQCSRSDSVNAPLSSTSAKAQQRKTRTNQASTRHAADTTGDLVNTYGKCPPDGEYGLPVECGSMTGWLCLEYINASDPQRTGECIYSYGDWYTRNQFKLQGGYSKNDNWRTTIRHFGQTIKKLEDHNVITLSPPSCSCTKCALHETKDKGNVVEPKSKAYKDSTGESEDALVKTYGERPPNGEYGLPIEAGSMTGWFCLQYVNEENPGLTGACIYSHGNWYTRSNFKNLGGCQGQPSWQLAIKHFGRDYKSLVENYVVTLSPPSCSCDRCVENGSMVETELSEVFEEPRPKRARTSVDHSDAYSTKSSREKPSGYIGEDLVQEYGERPPGNEFALAIECGTERAWLCIGYINESSPQSTGECIYYQGNWCSRWHLIKRGSPNAVNWKKAFKHFGKTVFSLLNNNTIIISPPSCSCARCTDEGSMVETELPEALEEPRPQTPSVGHSDVYSTTTSREEVSPGYTAEELVQEYGERPPDEEFALPIECGSEKGWLCMQYFDESSPISTGECVYSQGNWFTRSQFVKRCVPNGTNWRHTFRHFGKTMFTLLSKNIISISPPSCCCAHCTGEQLPVPHSSPKEHIPAQKRGRMSFEEAEAVATSLSQGDPTVIYGERPPDEHYTLPIECGNKKGWLCLQYVNESDPISAGEVIYSNGQWYTRTQFRKLGGYETQADWRKAFRHFGKVLHGLMTKNILTVSPPACKCDYCPKVAPKENSYKTLRNAQLIEQYGERPPDGVYAVPVESGPKRGWLCLEYIDENSPLTSRECIYSHGEWFTRCGFKKLGGYENYGCWQDGIWHFGKLIKGLLKHNVMTISPPFCKCDFCIKNPAPKEDNTLRNAKLCKEYGERPPDGVYAVPIESGPKKGWLCLEYVDDSNTSVSRECIYSHGEWFICSKFKKLGGYNYGSWDDGIWHFGQLMKGLLKSNVMTISPPFCKCDFCIGNAEFPVKSQTDLTLPKPTKHSESPVKSQLDIKLPERTKHSTPKDKSCNTLIRSVKEYGERPPDGVFALPVESGPKKGWLCLEYIDEGSPQATGECIYSHGEWYTRCKFKNLGGYENRGDWKASIWHFGQLLKRLFKHNVIVFSPPSCKCDFCIDTDTKLLREYGERPRDVAHSLPVECGPKRGWMCLEYIDQASPHVTGECIYYRGEWYTRSYFKKLGGLESTGDWKMAIKHFGRSLRWLLKHNITTIFPASCSCEQCTVNELAPSEDGIKVKKEVLEDDLDTASYVGSGNDVEDVGTDTTGNNHPQLAIQVECADTTAWMCVGMIASAGQKTKECVLLKGRLLTPFSFMKECGFGGGNWKLNIKHFGESVSLLTADGILTTSPPECGCDICEQDVSISQRYVCLQCNKLFTTKSICREHIGNVHNSEPIPDAASSERFDSESLVDSSPRIDTPTEQLDECPYGPELVLSVECGTNKAWLCLGYIERFRKSTEECILFNGEMVLPSEFVGLDDKHKVESEWRSRIKHNGRPLKSLLDEGIVTLIPPACHCDVCNSSHPEDGKAYMCSQCFVKFGKIESCEKHMATSHRPGERPEGPEFSVPVESGPYKGWMCVGRIKENISERTGPCILFNGQWLTPSQLAFIAGKQRGEWQGAITHGGLSIRALIRAGTLTASPPACRCRRCRNENAVCTTYICGLCDSTFTTMEAHRDHVTLIHNQVLSSGCREASASPSELMGATPAKRPRLASPSQASPPTTSTRGVPVVDTITTLSPPPAQSLAPRPTLATTIKDLTAEEIFAKLMERQAVFVCTCGIVFRDRVLFYLHRGMHSSDDPYKCSFCGHVAPNWYDFNSHTFTHSSS